jgi:hypothetical protein
MAELQTIRVMPATFRFSAIPDSRPRPGWIDHRRPLYGMLLARRYISFGPNLTFSDNPGALQPTNKVIE